MIQPIGNDACAVRGEHALGVELHSAQVQRPVAQGHHLPLGADGGALQAAGERPGVHHPGVVAADGELLRQAHEQVVVRHPAAGGLHAVEDVLEVDERAAEGLAEGLFAQADAQDGLLCGVAPDGGGHQPGLGRDAGPGREHQLVEGRELFQGEAVVAEHADLRPELLDKVHQVVGERVVVVDHCDTHRAARVGRRARWLCGARRVCC